MSKRIFRTMSLLILVIVLILGLLWGLVFSGVYASQMQHELKTIRVSIIEEKGNVVFDNMADPNTLENHANRREVVDAIKHGSGESKRYSDTMDEITYYYAVRLTDGNILRLALTTSSVSGRLYRFIPLLLICLALAAVIAFIIARSSPNELLRQLTTLTWMRHCCQTATTN